MIVLLTGATGFIGKHVYDKLSREDIDLHVTSRNILSLKNSHVLDILDRSASRDLIKIIKPDVLIHLAWDVTHGEFWSSDKNPDYATATINLFNIFQKNGGKKIIAAGTCAEYAPSSCAVDEDSFVDIKELTPYGRAKKTVFDWLENQCADFTWLRIFGIYGEAENKERLFPSMIRAIKLKQEFLIKNPDTFFDYVYVDDIAKFTVDSLKMKGVGAINIGTGGAVSISDLYNMLKNYIQFGIWEYKESILTPNANSRIPNCEKLKKYGFQFRLENGLDRMVSGF